MEAYPIMLKAICTTCNSPRPVKMLFNRETRELEYIFYSHSKSGSTCPSSKTPAIRPDADNWIYNNPWNPEGLRYEDWKIMERVKAKELAEIRSRMAAPSHYRTPKIHVVSGGLPGHGRRA